MKILTDSAADLQAAEKLSLGIVVAPLAIHFPEREVSAEEIAPDDFYDRLRAMVPEIPTTSQPSAGAFADIYRRLGAQGEELLSIHISSGLSGTLESAKLGAQQITNMEITQSGGQRYQVLAAAWGTRAEWAKEAILDQVRRVREGTEVIYTLETLEQVYGSSTPIWVSVMHGQLADQAEALVQMVRQSLMDRFNPLVEL